MDLIAIIVARLKMTLEKTKLLKEVNSGEVIRRQIIEKNREQEAWQDFDYSTVAKVAKETDDLRRE